MARLESHMCVLVMLNAKMVFSALKNIVKALLSPPPPPSPSSRGAYLILRPKKGGLTVIERDLFQPP